LTLPYHPLHEQIGRPLNGLSYYWTAPQTEFASDVIFRDQASLDRLFPRLILHGILNLWRSVELTHLCSARLTQRIKAGGGAFSFQVVEGVAV
jgi:hypothetical protein